MSELPKGWVSVTLNKVVDKIVGGGTPSKSIPSYYEGDIPWMTVKDMNKSYLTDTIDHITQEAIENSSTNLIPAGTPIIATRMSLGKIVRAGFDSAINQDLKALFINREVSDLYFEYWYRSQSMKVESLGTGTTVKGIRLEVINALEFPLAPLPEQKRIVEKLDEVLAQVDTIKARLDGIPDLLKRFRQSVLASAVSGKLTEEWRGIAMIDGPIQKNLGDVITNIGQGWSPKCESTPAENGEWGVIKTSSVQNISFIEHENKALPKSLEARPEHELLAGDILTTRAGPRVRCGITAYVDTTRPNLMICDKVYRYRVKESEGFSKYLVYLLNAPQYLAEIEKMKTGISDSGMNLTQSKFKQLPLFWPHIEEQKEIVRLVDQYFAFADTIEAQVKKAQVRVDNLTQSILAKAFRGELVAQDPNDEPAEVLLKRIAKARAEAEQLAKAAKKAGKKKA
ncbi:restriction endonuclease subunit S [Vibrio fluvialis]|uniref:restriction endonuclease subunit S n=1 Tax=Vibrio fluvialis TaxID=676 RepID=UPI00192BC4A7|nr:restriction endonuclease subunit S [Vibrio fluvialis]MBL4278355.1 restriction endonuclease subunit S [Vibrio fluvialis]